MGKLSFAFVLASSLTAAAQAAISGIKVTPTGVPAFKGRKDVPIAQVTFTASQAAQAEKVRLDIRGTNPSDVLCLSLGQSECARVANDAATFTVPVKAGENTFPLFAQLSDEATVSGSLCIAGERIRIGSVVTRPAQEISDRRLPDGRLRASKNFRIPGIVKTPKGNLVAVFDIRYKHAGDLPADITVGASTSADGGNTWSPIVTAMDYAGTPGTKQGIGDPAILVDPSNNRLWIMAMRTPDSGHPIWSSSAGTTGHETCAQLYVAYSDDEGKTWSKPRNITAELKNPGHPEAAKWGILFDGPGAGIVLKNGTLVFPGQAWGDKGKAPRHGTLIYSKDHGKTWQVSNGMPFGGSESTVVQLADGSILLNTREGTPGRRTTARTTDLGQTWQKLETSPLIQPGTCQAAMVRVGNTLVFSNPNSAKGRNTMSLRVSKDNGKTWSKGLVYDPRNCAGYSSLCDLGDGAVGVLYEGNSDYLYFLRVPVKDIP